MSPADVLPGRAVIGAGVLGRAPLSVRIDGPGSLPLVVPVALVAVIAGIDVALPDRYTAMVLLVCVPALTLLRPSGGRFALLAGVLALAAAGPLAAVHRDAHPVVAAGAIAGIAGTTAAMWVTARRQQRSDAAQAELRRVAETVQRAVLRPVPEELGAVRAQVRYLAADAQARVGGDLYDVVATPFGVRLIIGDVMGKGLDAVQRATDVLGAFRELAHHEKSLPEVAARLDGFMAAQGREEEFVTALLAEVSEMAGAVEMVVCGHPPPLLLRADGLVEPAVASPASAPLGLLSMADGWCPSATLELDPGDRMLLYTDGVSDARDAAGRFYPLAERVGELCRQAPPDLMERLESDLRRHAGGRLQDDAAMLLVRFGA